MRAGKLRHLIYLQSLTGTNDGGDYQEAWATTYTIRAEMDPKGGTEYFSADQVQDRAVVVWRVRYQDGITTDMRLIHRETTYNILSVANTGGRDRELLILTEAMPQEHETFAYSALTFASGVAAGGTFTLTVTWTTSAPASTNIRFGERVVLSWTTKTEKDTDPTVLSHSFTQTGFKVSEQYSICVYGKTAHNWTPGWSTKVDFNTDASGGVTLA